MNGITYLYTMLSHTCLQGQLSFISVITCTTGYILLLLAQELLYDTYPPQGLSIILL